MNLAHPGGLLHSARDPAREATRFAESLARETQSAPPDQSILVIIGIGWGHHIAPIGDALPHHRLVFFEPIAEVGDILREGRLEELRASGAPIALNPEELRAALDEYRAIAPESVAVVLLHVLPAYLRLFPDIARDTRALLGSGARGDGDVDRATAGRFMRQWARNFFINLRENETLEFIASPSTVNRPASTVGPPPSAVLYCGAGPELLRTLEPRLETLRDPERDIAILAADSALAPLLYMGIRPDIVISVDSGRGTAYHYRAAARVTGPGLASLPILTWTAGPRFARRWFERVIYYRSTLPFDQVLGDGGGPLSEIPEWSNASRNPAGLALLFAHGLGTDRVLLAGADFRARGDRTHERGTGYTLYALEGVNRTRTLEMYRPGGYGEDMIGKNRLARQGLEKLANALGLKLTMLSEAPASGKRNESNAKGDLLATGAIDAREAREHLRAVWKQLDFASLPGPPDAAQIRKWRSLLI